MAVTLYDSLGTIYKNKGKFLLAYHYYHRASTYDKPTTATSYTRKVYMTQIQKINGDFSIAWQLLCELTEANELMNDSFLDNDIAFASCVSTPADDARHLQRCYDFIDYTHNEDADGEEFTDFIPDAFAELGYIYWYKMQDADRALKCYHREMKLRVPMLRRTNCYVFNVLLGPCPERMADIHVRRDKKKAIRLYQQACDECVDEELKIYGVTMGRCLSKLAQLQAEHRTDNFRKAFQYLFDCAGKHYTIHRETIAKCYLCLAKCQEPVRKAIEYAEQALFLFVIDPLSLEHSVDQCCDLIIDLHRKVRSPSMVEPKKDHLLQRRKVQEINDEHIERMLQNTLTGLSKRTTK